MKHHAYNERRSNEIGAFRDIPDTRHISYDELVPACTPADLQCAAYAYCPAASSMQASSYHDIILVT